MLQSSGCPLLTAHCSLPTMIPPLFLRKILTWGWGSGSQGEACLYPPRGERQGLPGAGFQCIMPAITVAPHAGALARRSGETDG